MPFGRGPRAAGWALVPALWQEIQLQLQIHMLCRLWQAEQYLRGSGTEQMQVECNVACNCKVQNIELPLLLSQIIPMLLN